MRYKNELVAALLKEMELRRGYFDEGHIETIYFGGGTPSLCTGYEISELLKKIHVLFPVEPGAEVTLEANPDDISITKLQEWKKAGVNRLSIGIQSFFEEDLRWMNRAHSANQALQCLELATQFFNNITIDLIYGTPGLTHEKWKQNVDTALALNIPHLSCYALTVEPKTPLDKLILQQRSPDIDPAKQSEQFLLLMQWLRDAGFEHYEISNFAKPGFRSRHNSSYWQGKKYLGLGPSAHSFDGSSRSWNISNNNQYIKSIETGLLPLECEELTSTQQHNEYIMISLRTMEGIDCSRLDETSRTQLLKASKKFVDSGLLKLNAGHLVLTDEGKLLADGIAADLFKLD